MLTDDKIKAGENYSDEDNINTRDQNRSGIILLALFGLFVAGLIGLGMAHAPSNPAETQQQPVGDKPPAPAGALPEDFDIRRDIGAVELPGTIGKDQHFLSGHGNTPVSEEQAAKAGSGPLTGADAVTAPAVTPAPAGH